MMYTNAMSSSSSTSSASSDLTTSSEQQQKDEATALYEELVPHLIEGMSGAQIESLCRERILSKMMNMQMNMS